MARVRTQTLPLIGLLEDTILPGEERTLAAPAVDTPTLGALQGLQGARIVALSVASRVELPSLITQRWATEATVVSVEPSTAVLRGEVRVRVRAASGKEVPYQAVIERPVQSDRDEQDVLAKLVVAAHEVIASVQVNALPDDLDRSAKLHALAGALLRTFASPEELRAAQAQPVVETLAALAQRLASSAEGHQASCQLEQALRAIAEHPKLTDALRRRLWGQVVEIQTRLDVYDPMSSVEDGDEIGSLQRKLQQAGLPKAAREVAKRQIRLLRSMKSDHHDYSVYVSHLQLMSRLAWHSGQLPAVDLDMVKQVLDRDHAGLEKAKRRILEYLAVRALGGECRSTVLCFAGPPGTGKTSVSRSIAEALGRKFVRVSLGGVHDECELRGHRLTFSAASPGRIVSGLARVGTNTAVVLLDEIDKVGTDRQRSPNGALLEILDPEQNPRFHDNYLGVPYDLSHVLFICTANDMSAVPETLRDRLDTIELEGYTLPEKVDIATRHLLPKLAADHGLPAALSVEAQALVSIIEGHTRESGVRQLQRSLASIHRSRALQLVRTGRQNELDVAVNPDEVRRVLGPPQRDSLAVCEDLPPGVCTGLSVGPHGGSILFIEVGRMAGRAQLQMTGRLGEVMRESAEMVLAHLRTHAFEYGIEARELQAGFHVHVPDAATAKDGPSGGIALVLAFLSCVSGIPIAGDLAVSGEVTLSGRVLPVGGVRAKLLAAERAGARRVILPADNRADLPAQLAVEPVLVSTVREAVSHAFGAAVFRERASKTKRRHHCAAKARAGFGGSDS